MARTRGSGRERIRCQGCFAHAAQIELCAACAGMPSVQDALAAGSTIRSGQYQLGLPLGTPGGFGITYHGWDNQLDRRVAIKEFFPRDMACRNANRGTITAIRSEAQGHLQQQLDGFLDEARRAACIEHDHVVRILDFTEENGTGYIVMPFYEGETLSDFRARQPGQRIEWKQAVHLMFPVLSALDAVHEVEMIHRDVKPSNIYLARTRTGSPRPILIDFGSARITASSRELTGILTQGYAPLEQYDPSGKGQGPWTDLYAVAATLHELISGVVPPSAPARQLGRPLVDLRTLPNAVPHEFQTVLQNALRLEPGERIQTADALIRAIAGTTGLAPTQRRLSPPPRKRTKIFGALSAVVGGVALSGSALWWMMPDRPRELPVGQTREQAATDQAALTARTGTQSDMGARSQSRAQLEPDTLQNAGGSKATPKIRPATEPQRRERAIRAEALQAVGDYMGAWYAVQAPEDSATRRTIADACRADSVMNARRNVTIQCPPASAP